MARKIRDPETSKLIARMQRDEDRAAAERRRKLAKAIARALPSLDGGEMYEIEQIIWKAIGRAACER